MSDTVLLPDVNTLVAAHLDTSPVRALARSWLSKVRQFATTPMTEAGRPRVLMASESMPDVPVDDALRALEPLRGRAAPRLWPDDSSLASPAIELRGLLGRKAVTDLRLVNFATHHGGVLVSPDGKIERSLARGDRRHVLTLTAS